jgi:broad specificity phosphatase PhoE
VRLFVIARHGESTLNIERRVNGDPEVQVALTEQGRDEARLLGQQLAHVPIEVCVHTRFGRTRETAAIALTYETERLGELGLRLEIAPGVVRARVEARAGSVYELADDESDALRKQLVQRTGRAAEVTVVPRREHFDAYA